MQAITCNLSNCFLCSFCIPEWKEAIAFRKTTLHIKKGKQLFAEGEKVKGIFFIYSGALKIHKQWIDEKELILRFAKAGDIAGHRGLGGADKYPVSATALEDTKACFITNEFFEALLKTDPALTHRLMNFYVSELQKAEKRMRDLAHMDVRGRIAGALLEIASFFGVDKDKFISVVITRQDIASYSGTTYETVFKFFTDLTQKKIITTSGKSIRINQPELLKRFID